MAVVVYLINDAQRERNVQYQEFQDVFNNALDLWASARLSSLSREIEPALSDETTRQLFASRRLAEIGARLTERVGHLVALGEATQLRVLDRNGRPLITLPPAAAQQGDDASDLRNGNVLHVFADGRARLRLVVPWSMANGDTAYVELIDNKVDLSAELAPRIGAAIYAMPDALAGPVTAENLPPSLAAVYQGLGDGSARHAAALVSAIVSHHRSGMTGLVDGKYIDIVPVSSRPNDVLAHNDVLVIRDSSLRELSIHRSMAIALIFAFALMVLIAIYAVYTGRQLVSSVSRDDAARLREGKERLAAIMDTVADAIVTVDRHGFILSANHATSSIFGYGSAELEGRSFDLLICENEKCEQPDLLKSIRDLTIWRKDRVDGEVYGHCKDGSCVPIALSLTCGVIDGEDVATVVLRDITEQKAAKDQLIEAVQEQKAIQQALRQRSDELVRAARELSKARDKAEAANAAKSRFLATMSHELRTPMNGILGMTSLLVSSPLTPEQKSWAATIKESGDALLTLLNDILDLSKIEAGKLEVHPTVLDPVVLVRHIATTWAPLAEAKGLTFKLIVPDEGREVMGDAVRLRQILANLVSNAIKFTDAGEVCVRLHIKADGTSRARMRFEVCDTGIGIAQDKLGLLFQKFSQVDGSLARRHGGSGLGLAICRELAALMGGDVGVDTSEGIGSVFWLELGCDIVPGEGWSADAQALPPPPSALIAPDENRRLKILVAEDHPVNQSLFKALIDHLGHDLDVVSNGAQAVAALQRAPYDMVLLDAHMPVMDGPEAAAQIRRLDGPVARIPLIVVTADAMVGDRERYLAAGMDDYITKPIDLRELAAAIARHAPTRHALPGRRTPPGASFAGAAE